MLRKFRAITQVFLIPLGLWNTKIKVLCVRILVIQNVPGSRSNMYDMIFNNAIIVTTNNISSACATLFVLYRKRADGSLLTVDKQMIEPKNAILVAILVARN